MRFLSLLQHQIEKHKLIRRLTLGWACGLITYATVRVFSDVPPDVPSGTAAAFGVIVGILTAVIGFYTQWRAKEDQHCEDK